MSSEKTSGFTLGNSTYDRLKFVVMIVLPASAALYIAVAALWGLPKVEEVAGTITAIATFLGVLLGISSKNYSSEEDEPDVIGDFVVAATPNGKAITLELSRDPVDYVEGDLITFRLKEAELDEEDLDVYRGDQLP